MITTKTTFKTYKEALTAVGTAYERALDLCKGVDNHEAVEVYFNVEVEEIKRTYNPRLNRQGRRALDTLQEAMGVLLDMYMLEQMGVQHLPPS